MNKFILPCFLLFVLLSSCAKDTKSDAVIYSNTFETGDLKGVTNGAISSFNNTQVLGMYNNSGFDLTLNDLPDHDIVVISFDLYVHDSWDGNKAGLDNMDGPDIWQLKADGSLYINTTFSNNDCPSGTLCAPQSYPADYPNNYNNPKTGASKTDLPGVCSWATNAKGSTLYKISKRISHTDKILQIQCLDKLSQKNAADPKCDESWSVDNIVVSVINQN